VYLTEDHCLSQDPQFVDAAAGDYRLQTNSPCIDAGQNRLDVGRDLVDAVRPLDGDGDGHAGWDMGAYEAMRECFVAVAGSPRTPFSCWAEAATNIADAVAVADAGTSVLVSNGTYRLSAEISVTNGITVRGVNGPATVIVDGTGAVRGFNLLHTNAVIEGLTITNGAASIGGGVLFSVAGGTVRNCMVTGCRADCGGGIFFAAAGGLADRCVLRGNQALTGYKQGGGGYGQGGAVFRDCLFTGNRANEGGGLFLYGGLAENCTLATNSANWKSGGVRFYYGGTVSNCVVYGNTAASADPNWGYIYTTPSIAFTCTTPLPAGPGNVAADPMFFGTGTYPWQLSPVSPCVDAAVAAGWTAGAVDLAGRKRQTGRGLDMGAYEVPYAYAVPAGTPTFPYDTWGTAATNIQLAINAVPLGVVMLTDGLYRVAATLQVTNAVRLTSVNGSRATRLDGGGTLPVMTIGHTNAVIDSLTITNGRAAGGAGGGIYVSVPGGTIRNCRVTGCHANAGGGVFFAAAGGLADGGALTENDALGEPNGQGAGGYGRSGSVFRNCLVAGNRGIEGGGLFLYGGMAEHCTIAGNNATLYTGGIRFYQGGAMSNSIAYRNTLGAGASDWGSFGTPLPQITRSCLTPDPGSGIGNVTGDPKFCNVVAGDYHLGYASAAIDGATASVLAFDLDGASRPVDGNFDGVAQSDMGCYEYNPVLTDTDGDQMPDSYEHQYGLNPTNAADRTEDPDHDGHDNWEEYVADTDPSSAASILRIRAFTCQSDPPWLGFFPASTNRLYVLETCTVLGGAWTNIPGVPAVRGTGGTNWFETPPMKTGPMFHRVRVDVP
jgi:hypothetical protein